MALSACAADVSILNRYNPIPGETRQERESRFWHAFNYSEFFCVTTMAIFSRIPFAIFLTKAIT